MKSKLKPHLLPVALIILLALSGLVFAARKIQTVYAANKIASLAEYNFLSSPPVAPVYSSPEQVQKQQIKSDIKFIEQDIKTLEKQLAILARRKVAVPSFSFKDISDNITKIKALIKKIKAAQNWDEVSAAGAEVNGLMLIKLDQDRHQVEVLTLWPQTLKQISQELNRLVREVKRAKPIIERLFKKEANLTDVYREFEAGINKIKSTLAEANTKILAGESEAGFSLIETDLFDQMDNVAQNYHTIITIGDLGRFASYLKQNIAANQHEIKLLQKKGIDTSELQDLLNQIQTKGDDVLAMIKDKPADEEAILSGIQDVDELKQDFADKVNEITGEEEKPQKKSNFFSKAELSSKVLEAIVWLQGQVKWKNIPLPTKYVNVPPLRYNIPAIPPPGYPLQCPIGLTWHEGLQLCFDHKNPPLEVINYTGK